MSDRRGFTLVEVLLTLVILAAVAALIIVNERQGRREYSTRGSSASLKTLASAQADFRGNDRDGNKVQDFWTRDVAGLYGLVPVGSTEMIKLIEISVAGADFAAAGTAAPGAAGLEEVDRNRYIEAAPKAGYWYQRMLTDDAGLPYQTSTGGVEGVDGPRTRKTWWNPSKFGFYAFPDSFSAGRNVFFINEGNTIFKRAMNGPVKAPSDTPSPAGVVLRVGKDALIGSQPAEAWPADAVLKVEYSKLD